MSSSTRVIPSYKIQPCSIIADSTEIISRDILFPFIKIKLTDECNDIKYIYTCYAEDNSKATILKATEIECFKNKYTLNKVNDSISGTKIHIQTVKRIGQNKMKLVNQTGRHKAQKITLTNFTCVELLKEETNIISSENYQDLLFKKQEQDDSYGQISLT
jgi:hypothetical protein